MKARTRYQVAFFGLGWLIALAVLFQLGFGSVSRFWTPIRQRLGGAAKSTTDAGGDPVRDAGGGSRKDYLEPMKLTLSSMGALRRPPRMLFGVNDGGFPNTFAGMEQLEDQLRYRFPIISFYSSWGDKPDQQFPARMVESIQRMGSVPVITWEPWVVDFDERLRTNLPPVAEREYATLRAIARSDYDFYLVPWAKAAAANKKPIFIRFAREMNDPYRHPWGPQNGNRPEDFVAAWKHIHFIFQKSGATNVLWIWAPHISMPWLEFYYPGPQYVDWIGAAVLNYGTIASWSRWWSFDQIFGKAYPVLTKLNKPIMITEVGTVGEGGDIGEWYDHAFDHLDHTYQRGVRAVILFNQQRDATVAGHVLNWSPAQDPRAMSLIARELARHSAM